MKALIIENDPLTVEAVSLAFQFRWPEATLVSAAKGAEGAELVEKESPDVVILDLGLPDIDGMEVLRAIRTFSDVPVIILTARTDQISITKGLEEGADDYVKKPFDYMELLARVKSVLGRSGMPQLRGRQTEIAGGGLVIELATRTVTVNGKPAVLTTTEWILLSELVRNEGREVSNKRLAEKLWGETAVAAPSTMRSYINRLRFKLGDALRTPKTIVTEYGAGYRFVRPK